jgi:hypothetical protein
MSESRKSPRSNKGERPKYYTNYAKDKSGAPRKMLGVGGQKESGMVVPKRGSLTRQATNHPLTPTTRGAS